MKTDVTHQASLSALSPLDGRYASLCAPLRDYFSEAALIKYRILVEVLYLNALMDWLDIDRLDPSEKQTLLHWAENLDAQDLEQVKNIEASINHDVKAVEYFIRDHLDELSLSRYSPWVHWGLTSEDVDNLAYGLMIRKAKDEVFLPAQIKLVQTILGLAKRYSSLVMLARTHGQIAVPTTVGKEFVVFASRATFFLEKIISFQPGGKLNGAVGNFNAHYQIFPQKNWPEFSRNFIQQLGLEPTIITTQLEPATRLTYLLDLMRQLNNIWLDLARDCWLYIMLGYFQQKIQGEEIGSSTMPHKVNPIDFENAEGNLQVANSLLMMLANKLPLSRLQRDLSDKTVKRNIGMAWGYSLVAAKNLERGLGKITPNDSLLQEEVRGHPEILAEAVQLLLKKRGDAQAFQVIQAQVRNKRIDWAELTSHLEEEIRKVVESWRPEQYVGLATQLTNQEIARIERVLNIHID